MDYQQNHFHVIHYGGQMTYYILYWTHNERFTYSNSTDPKHALS